MKITNYGWSTSAPLYLVLVLVHIAEVASYIQRHDVFYDVIATKAIGNEVRPMMHA